MSMFENNETLELARRRNVRDALLAVAPLAMAR